MMDFYDLDLETRRLCTPALIKDEMAINTICKYFESLSNGEQAKFLNISKMFYDFNKRGSRKYKITKNAVYIANRIKQDIQISCYPYIEKIATKGWSTRYGTFSWGIKLLSSGEIDREIFSFEPARLYLRKNVDLNIGQYNSFTVISVEKTK